MLVLKAQVCQARAVLQVLSEPWAYLLHNGNMSVPPRLGGMYEAIYAEALCKLLSAAGDVPAAVSQG